MTMTQDALIPAPTVDTRPLPTITTETWLVQRLRPRATPTTCRACHAPIVKARTPEPGSFLAIVDPRPVGELGEALAVLAGLATYELVDWGTKCTIELRLRNEIRRRPIYGYRYPRFKYDVLVEHSCGSDIPRIESTHSMPSPPAQYDECPF